MAAGPSPPVVPLPPRVDRRMRFGPFPSTREALKFSAYAAAGALVIPFAGTWAWLAVLGLAFLLSAYAPDGRALDERFAAYLGWQAHAFDTGGPVSARLSASARGGIARVPGGFATAVLRCAGTPIAFLPPEDLQRKFGEYRELLRAADGGLVLACDSIPIDSRAFTPRPIGPGRPEARAREGYAEMVSLLCSRRLRRRIYVLLSEPEASAPARDRLEGRVRAVHERLSALGVDPTRLEDAALDASLRRFGWVPGRGGGR